MTEYNEHEALHGRIEELERELQQKSEKLQQALESLETTNQELLSTNEELTASNEELHRTNKEVQFVNEELYKVNAAHIHKIDELTQLNADFDNLHRNTFIGDLYLDRHLAIRKINQVAASITNITFSDIGKPLRHVAENVLYDHFFRDIESVAETQVAIEQEVCDSNGKWYLMRVVPYMTRENIVDGVLISFIDISNQKRVQNIASDLNIRLDNALKMGEMSWWEWDYETNRVNTGVGKYRMLGYEKDEMGEGYEAWTKLIHPDDYEPSMEAMRAHLKGEATTYFTEFRIRHKFGHYLWYRDNGGIVTRTATGKPKLLIGIVQNISREKAQEQKYVDALKQAHQKEAEFSLLFNELPQSVLLQSSTGEILDANPAALELFGLGLDELKGRLLSRLGWTFTRENEGTFSGTDFPGLVALRTGQKQNSEIFGAYDPKREKNIRLMVSAIPVFKENEPTPCHVYSMLSELK